MSEYIDRDDLIEDIEQRYCKPCEKEGKDYNHTKCKACWVDDMIGEIGDAPFYNEMAPIVHGKWEHTHTSESYFNECWRCSACGFDDTEGFGFKFCPNCGADMRGGKP